MFVWLLTKVFRFSDNDFNVQQHFIFLSIVTMGLVQPFTYSVACDPNYFFEYWVLDRD